MDFNLSREHQLIRKMIGKGSQAYRGGDRRHLLAQRPQDCGGLEAVPPHRAAGIK